MSNAVQASPASPTPSSVRAAQPEQPCVVPPVDVFENDASITLLADLPGVGREQLQVRVDGDNLVLEATAATTGPADMQLVYGEAQIPTYRRQFTLSRELDASRIEAQHAVAQLRDGVLRLTIPKPEEARPRRIQVQVR